MNILTKVKQDHLHMHNLLKKIIVQVQNDKQANILWEDLLEEINEHMQAEKVCLSEMLAEEQKQKKCIPSQISRETLYKLLSEKLYQDIESVHENKGLKSKLYAFEKLLQEHSHYIENTISLLSSDCITDQKSEELSLRFEEEKIKAIINGITYA